jgi:Heterokaryon incompatibility protein (HET)
MQFIREREGPGDLRHLPLDHFTDEIRVFYLLPHEGNEAAPIHCQMGHIPLGNVEPESFQRYKALSYMWGTSEDMLPIFVNGNEFKVTQNLYAAFLKLRQEDSLKAIWADAFCINQDDLLEKGRQISRMITFAPGLIAQCSG